MKDERLIEAVETLEELRRNPDAIIAYHSYLKTMIDEEAKLDYAERKGIEQGIKKIAKKMIAKGHSNEGIMDVTDLTFEEVEKIRHEGCMFN